MNTAKTAIHFTDNYLLNPTNPISVNLIGAGGTGSKVLTALMEINESLIALGHAGLQVRLWDDDVRIVQIGCIDKPYQSLHRYKLESRNGKI